MPLLCLNKFAIYYDVIMTDYRDNYLDAMKECDNINPEPLFNFIQYSYFETLERVATFFKLVSKNGSL